MHFKRRFVYAVTLLCFSCVHLPFAEAHEVSANVKNMEESHGSPKLRSNGKKHRNDDDDDDDGDSLPQKQKLPGGTLVAPIPAPPPIGATPPNSHAGAVIHQTNMPPHKIPQEQPLTINAYQDNSGGHTPHTIPVAGPRGVRSDTNTGI